MSATPIAIKRTGLVTAVGLTAPQSCAAFRAKVANPTETRFIDSGGDWIVAHQVALEQPWRGLSKLAKMAAMAIGEVLVDVPKGQSGKLPLLLCVAEPDRPGRMAELDDQIFPMIEKELGIRFAPESVLVPQGRVSVAMAMLQARSLLAQGKSAHVLVAATDSLLSWPTLSYYEQHDRLLTQSNSNGFIPGEGAGALLLAAPDVRTDQLVCTGIGFGREAVRIASDEPQRADGLTQAIKAALLDAGCQMHDLDFRITDISGERYYFKEAALALSRTLRQRKVGFDLWHPAECTGEVGAAAGTAIIADASAACEKQYTRSRNLLTHMSTDAGDRAALSLQYRVAA
jgi:3-oxoacyl-[acyl-carrier-protein] synthase-1